MADQPPPSLNQRVGDGIRAELARTGMSRPALAKHLGISAGSLRRRLDDEMSFRVSEVEEACLLFGIGPHELIREAIKFDSVRISAREVIIERGGTIPKTV